MRSQHPSVTSISGSPWPFTKKQMKAHLFTMPPGKKQHQPDVPVPAFSKMAMRIPNFPSCPSPLWPENANVAETETMCERCITCS